MRNNPLTQPIKPLSLCIFAALFLPAVTQAAEAESAVKDDVEVIEVTGMRQAYRGNVQEKDLPQAISSITFDTLEFTGITNLQNSLELVSGVTRQNDFGGLWDMFAIRGFAGDENLPSAYLINGFSAGRGFSGNRDMSNVEVMEVLKGPGSALYGRGEPGGTVNIITKKPQFDQSGYIKFTAGSFDTYRTEGDFTTGLTEKLAFRINGAYEEAESYRDTVESTKTVLTPSFLYQLNDDTTISYELEYLDQEAPMDRGVVVVDGKDFSDSNFYGEPADDPVEIEALGHQLQLQHNLSGDWAFSAGLSYRTSSFEGNATEARWYDADANYVVRQRRYRNFDADDISGRFEFSGSADFLGVQHNLLIGGDAYEYELDRLILRYRHNTAEAGTPESSADYYAIDFDNPVYRDELPDMIDNTSDVEEQSGQGVYFQDQIDLSDNWKAMFGMRYDRFEQDMTYRLDNDRKTSTSKSYFNPRLGLVYELSDDARVYASYSEGARPNSGTDADGNGHEPEESKSYEIGLKWDMPEQGFSGTTALFTTEKSNILASSPNGDGTTEAIGKAESKGIELDLSYALTPDTLVTLSYAYIDAQNAKEITLWDWYVIEEGDRLGNVPEHSGSLMVRQFAEFGGYEGSGGFVIQYVGTQLGDFLEQDYELPNYTLVNLFANVTLTENLDLNLSVNNLLDEEYYANSYFEAWTMPGAPRAFKASVKYTF
ncbi:TonB-dependent siderophore receptor [Shewanella saliphila]|uniref:TonB-dependent receptor n=1 Tax=Shewanella saliphila TaxID=2282698 RepID=A0ABQ2Q609_9GAMM|nr:TonB-dependent siderophore receptor [Shewanella saliphila]MCL1101876.1 TonB-dependent siderophore receptor [Shewanella saliphila]GGP52191.1 TonB-dependent receptor [Shewanella saliphila]